MIFPLSISLFTGFYGDLFAKGKLSSDMV